MLKFLGRTCARHHWLVLGLWVLAAVAMSVSASTWGGKTTNDYSIPGSDSEKALNLLAEDFPQLAGTSAIVVFETDGTTMDQYEGAVQQTVANLESIKGVASVSNPFATTTQLLYSQTSPNGTIAYSTVLFTKAASDIPPDSFDKIVGASQAAVDAGLNVQYGGNLVDTLNPPTSTISDYADEIGLLVALILLLFVFRSVFIAVLPIVNAIIGVMFVGGLITLLENSFTIPTVGPTLGTMLGLGVGVDYSLFILTRAYGELQQGKSPEEAMATALSTAGRAVIFAGLTICLASVALVVVGVPLIAQMGLVAAVYVVFMVIAAITLVPALGGAVGTKLLTTGFGEPVAMTEPATTGVFAGLARTVTKHPVVLAGVAVAVMLVLAAPVLQLQTGWVGDDAAPPDTTQRQATDILTHGFGPGVNGQLIITAATGPITADNAADVASLALTFRTAIADTPGVKTASPPFPDSTEAPTALAISVEPTTGPDDPATGDLVTRLRDETFPATLQGTSLEGKAHVGGLTATIIDLDAAIVEAMPRFMASVLGGAFLLLLVVFRSVLIGIKAVFMNLLTIAATFGVLVAVFQWGWASGLVGMSKDVDIVSFVPLIVFAIVFGLSMDYEVFLMSRMQEEYLTTKDPTAAVARSLGTTGRVIVSAALVMFAVFVAFVSNPSPMVKQIGLGLAVGVFVDALIVRLLLVPSIMRLLGNAGWWLPKWLDKIMPNISIEGEHEPAPTAEGGHDDPVPAAH